MVGVRQTDFERRAGLPAEHLPESRVVAVAPADPLRLGQVVPFVNGLSGNRSDDVDQPVDRDQAIGPEVQRLAVVRAHQPIDAADAVVDITVRTRLLAVAPHLDGVLLAGARDLAANRSRRFLTAAVVRAKRPVDVVKAHDPRLDAEVLGIMTARALHVQFFPPVAVLGVGRVRVLLFEWSYVRSVLQIAGVDARARGVQQSLDAVLARGLDRVEVDERVVPHDHGLVRLDEADAAHVGRERIDFVDAVCRAQAVLPLPQIEELEVMRGRRLVLRFLDVDAAHPISSRDKILCQVVTDESAGSGYENSLVLRHMLLHMLCSEERTGCFRRESRSLGLDDARRR